MKKSIHLILALCLGMAFTLTGCKKKPRSVWENSNTSSTTSARTLWGNDDDQFNGSAQEDFVALKDEDLKAQFSDHAVPQPAFTPGEAGSGLPAHSMFHAPIGRLSSIFKTVYFDTDEFVFSKGEYKAYVESIADYLKDNPETFVYLEGNADERGSEKHNFSLAAKRANYVRTLLVEKGVNPDQLHTISFGKDKPAVFGHNAEAWSKNRRVEFKIFERNAHN